MSKIDLEALKKELNATNHVGRVNKMLDLGRRAHDEPAARDAIDALGAGDVFERRMALLAQHTFHDGARVLASTRDVARSIRLLAFTLVPSACDDDQALEAMKIAFALRREPSLLRQLACGKRRVAVDRYLDWLADQPGVPDFADFIPYGTKKALEKHLPRALEKPSHKFWMRLSQGHADAFAVLLSDRLCAVPGEPDAVTRQLIEKYTAALMERAPEETSVLLELLLKRGIKSQLGALKTLSRLRPSRALEMIEKYDLYISELFAKSCAQLSPEELARVVMRSPLLLASPVTLIKVLNKEQLRAVVDAWCDVAKIHPRWGYDFFDHIPDPARRRAAYERWSISARNSDGAITLSSVGGLPVDFRELEARRHVYEIVAFATRPTERIAYARFLPWSEAEKVLKAYLGHPEGEMRGTALSVMLAIPGLRPEEPELTDRALAMVIARKNEQDPVRGVMLRALVSWPKKVWRKEHAKTVAQIIRDALDAGDLSHGTAQLAESLLVRTFGLDPEKSAELLAAFIKERGAIYDVRIGVHLTDDEVRLAAPHLYELAKTWSVRERVYQMAQLAESLGERLHLVPGLAGVLEKALFDAVFGGVLVAIISIFRRFDPPRYEKLLQKTMHRCFDMGWQSEILQLAALVDKPGRRLPPIHPELVAALEKIARGHGRNEHIYNALTLLRVRAVKDFDRLLPELLKKDESYIGIPVVHWQLHKRRQELLDPFLGERQITGRFATGKTAWLLPFTRDFHRWTPAQNTAFAKTLATIAEDKDRDTPTVWRCLAILAAMDSAPMTALASHADDKRPAVQERAIRVMARCDQGQCVPTLLKCLEDARARIAIYGFRKAVKDLLPKRALEILGTVAMTKVTVAKEVIRLYGELRVEAAYRRLVELDQTKLHRDVRIALLRALWDHLDREPTWEVYARAVTADDWVMASRLGDIPADRLTKKSDLRLSALLARVLDRPEPEARIDLLRRAAFLSVSDPERTFLTACSSRLRSLYDDEVTAAISAIMNRSTEIDLERLPGLIAVAMEDARCLHVAIGAMLSVEIRYRASWIGAARAAERVLARDPRWVALRLRCAASAMDPDELADFIIELGESGQLGFDALEVCRTIVATIAHEKLQNFGDRLRKSARPEVRRVALWVVNHDSTRGWTPERLERLTAANKDPDPSIAGAAGAISPPREMPPKEKPWS